MSGAQEFRASTDQMLELIDQLKEYEQSKQRVAFGSPEFVELAAEAENLSRVIFRWGVMQHQMAQVSAGTVERGEQSAAPLSEVIPRPLDRILAQWREAQLRLEIARPGSPESAAAADDIERLREEFHAAEELRRSQEA